MPADVPSFIRTYGAREFFSKSIQNQNKLLYDKFPLEKKSTLRMAKKRFIRHEFEQKRSPHVNKKKTVTQHVKSSPQTDQFSSLKSPPAASVHAEVATPTLSPYIKEILAIQQGFVYSKLPCSVKDAMELRSQAMRFEGMQDIPPWSLPPMITEKQRMEEGVMRKKKLYNGITKQEQIINAICDPMIEIVAVEAAKRHGKSTAAFVGICQAVWEGRFKKVGLWAAGEENALGILSDSYSDEINIKQTMPLFKGQGSRHQKVFFNNAILKAFSNNAARTSGLDFDLCWIDEAHEVVVEHREVFDMIIMTMRAKPTIKLLITMNKGTGTYHIFKDTLEKEFGKEVVFFTIEDEDILHITQKADAKVRKLVKAVGGKKEVDRWLNNKNTNSSTFDPMSVINAYQNYNLFLSTHNPVPAYTVASYDPSGTGHPMGYSIWSCDITGSYFWQRFGIEYELGERPEEWGKGEKLGPQQIKADMFLKAHNYKISHFISESNMDGKMRMIEFRAQGYESENQNFGNDKNKDGTPSRGAMCHIVRTIMDNQALFICSERLRNQWSVYNPDEHDKVAKFKGDEADSGIHAIYYLCTLTNSPYLVEQSFEMEWV